ncbi:MAG TPA: FecR domain-containing protein [Candidatus Nitrosotenuis sp.]|nr:FecR domain-containing protein [Candidatus Nitrosotenuis sp.]
MNVHQDIQDNVFDYLEGELPAAVARHLDVCPQCRAELARARALEAAARALPCEELPPGFEARLRARLERLEAGQPEVPPVDDEGPLEPSSPTPLPRRPPGLPPGARAPVTPRPWRALLSAAAAVLLGLGLYLLALDRTRVPVQAVLVDRLPPLAVVAAAEGPVEMAPSAGVSPTPVEQTVALEPGAVLETPARVRGVVVVGAQENEVRLGADTRLVVMELRRELARRRIEGRFQLTRGKVWIREANARLALVTPHATVNPTGTEYEAVAYPDRTEIVVYEGEVQVDTTDGQHLKLSAGQEMTVAAGTPGVRPSPIRSQRAGDSWVEWNRSLASPGRPGALAPLQPPAMRSHPRPLPGLLQALRQMSPQERQHLRQLARKLKAEERRALKERLASLSPQEQAGLLRQLGSLTPEEGRRLLVSLEALPPSERQEFLEPRDQVEELLALPDAELAAALKGMSRAQRRRLWQGMTREQKKRLLARLPRPWRQELRQRWQGPPGPSPEPSLQAPLPTPETEGAAPGVPEQDLLSLTPEELRRRWQSMSPEERQALKGKLGPRVLGRLRQRVQGAAGGEVEAAELLSLPPDELRRRLAGLSPAERRRLLLRLSPAQRAALRQRLREGGGSAPGPPPPQTPAPQSTAPPGYSQPAPGGGAPPGYSPPP